MKLLSYLLQIFSRITRLFGYNLSLSNTRPDLSLYDNFPDDSRKNRRFYNIGAGLFHHPYWTNIDYKSEHYDKYQKHPFLSYNLVELTPLPIESNTTEIIYSSHVIEHISNTAVLNMLKESYRVLKTGGCLRLTTPDIQLEYEAYNRNDLKFWYWTTYYSKKGTWEKEYTMPLSGATIHQLFLHHFASQLSRLDIDNTAVKKFKDDEIIKVFSDMNLENALDFFTVQCKYNINHPGNHINWWTYDKLFSFLQKAGFSTYYRSGCGQSRFASLRELSYFDKTHPAISLYVEAIK